MAVEYALSLREPHTHLFEVTIHIRPAEEPLELVMPVWTPGSYLVREFARNVQDFEAHDAGGRLAVAKTDKQTWCVEGTSVGRVTVRYRVHANELSVRTSHLDASHGHVNGASVFMYPRGMEGEETRLRIDAPDGWRVATSLLENEEGVYLAAHYDELVDSPIEIGEHRTIAWEKEGIPHRWAISGPGEVDEAQLVSDTNRIVETCARMFGGLPYDRFLFLMHILPNGRGGLEHRTSFSIQVSPTWLAGPDYEKLIALVAHEFFHVWLGKRIRPEPLGPFDYTRENYTRNLWVVEGFTTYYTDLLLVRAGLMTRERYLARLGDAIARHEALPGRHHQSLEESSFDAWIKFYRPDSHTPNSQVSYYQKGALVAFALDMEIRRGSDGAQSLDDVMRVLWERYGRADVGFPEARGPGIQAVMEEVHGASLADLLDRYVARTDEIDFDRHLDVVGLRLEEGEADRVAGAPPIEAPGMVEGRLGMRLREQAGTVRVMNVLAGTPAEDAGVSAGDEVVAIDGGRATSALLEGAANGAGEGEFISLSIMRRERLVEARLRIGPLSTRRARLAGLADADDGQRRRLESWLGAGYADGRGSTSPDPTRL